MAKTIVCRDINGKEYEVSIDELRWRPSAYGIILKGDKILLSPQFGGYDLPGGGIDLGETPEEAVIREIKEETGLDAANPQLLAVKNSFFKVIHTSPPLHNQTLMIYYKCKYVGGELSTDGFDEFEKKYAKLAEWFPIAELDTIKVAHSYDWLELVQKVAQA